MPRAFDKPDQHENLRQSNWTVGITAACWIIADCLRCADVEFADGIELGFGGSSGGICRQHHDAGCGAGADR